MGIKRIMFVAAIAAALLPATTASAGVRVGVGIGIGVPGPYWWGPRYYYPAYVGPAPVVYYAPGTVYAIPAASPTVLTTPSNAPPAPAPEETAPAPRPVPSAAPTQGMAEPRALSSVMTASSVDAKPQGAVAQWLPLLADADEKVRINAVTNLGRLKSAQALDPLAATLGGDRSPVVRAAAAKALAIIGDPRALLALQRAVQNDTDNDVRRTAQFAMEVIASR